ERLLPMMCKDVHHLVSFMSKATGVCTCFFSHAESSNSTRLYAVVMTTSWISGYASCVLQKGCCCSSVLSYSAHAIGIGDLLM
ncbi:MAG TPA: hypothetical protein ACQGQG_08385, partial [Xylella sp.]